MAHSESPIRGTTIYFKAMPLHSPDGSEFCLCTCEKSAPPQGKITRPGRSYRRHQERGESIPGHSRASGTQCRCALDKKTEARAASSGNWTTRPSQPSPTPGAEGEDSRDALFCTYCKKRRHTKENCWKLTWKNLNTGKKAYVSTSQPQSSGGPGPSPSVEEVQENISTTALVQSGNPSSQEWIATTGATDYMSPAEPLFRQYTPAERQHRIQTAREGTLPVKGVGEILLNPLGLLREVLHVEDLRANLISI